MSDDRTERLQSLKIDRTNETGGGGPGWTGLAIAALVSAALAAGAAWVLKPQTIQAAAPSRAAPVEAVAETAPTPAPAAPAPRASSGLVASGYVVARRQATVSAEITGRIREVLIEEGAVVAEGEVLARLDDERARIDLDLFEAQAAASVARVRSLIARRTEAQTQLERAQRLVETGFASDATLTAAIAERDSLNAQLRGARADADAAQARVVSQADFIERHVVRAPFAGVVIAKNAQVGEILSPVSAGGGFTRTGIATLVDMGSLELEVDVNEGQIQRVGANQQVEAVLDAYPDWRIPARVEAIIPTADRSRATIRVRVAFNERDQRILPDMAARVTFLETD